MGKTWFRWLSGECGCGARMVNDFSVWRVSSKWIWKQIRMNIRPYAPVHSLAYEHFDNVTVLRSKWAKDTLTIVTWVMVDLPLLIYLSGGWCDGPGSITLPMVLMLVPMVRVNMRYAKAIYGNMSKAIKIYYLMLFDFKIFPINYLLVCSARFVQSHSWFSV